jgi:aminoglycoside phosphotransferase (APT) family kinase protein
MQIEQEVRQWVEETLDGTVSSIERVFGGGSRQTFFVELIAANGVVQSLVLRLERGQGAFSGTEISLQREAVVYRALQDSGVPVPRVHASSDDGTALLLERISGEAAWHRIPAGEQRAVAMDFARTLAALHRLDPRVLALEGFTFPTTPEEHALQDLMRWRRLCTERTANDDPIVRFAFAWLAAHPPQRVQRTVLVQGDTGVGNFLAHQGRVCGLVDWEFSYIGDPMSDVAWVEMRIEAAQAESAFSGWQQAYERASGIAIDPAALLYNSIFVQLRCAVTTAMSIHQGGGALGLAGYLLANQRYRRRLAALLAQAQRIESETVVLPDSGPTTGTPLFDRALADLATLVRPALREPSAKVGAHAVRILLEHLRARDRRGAALAELERRDRRETFGFVSGDGEVLIAAERAGTVGDDEVLRYLVRRAAREGALWQLD